MNKIFATLGNSICALFIILATFIVANSPASAQPDSNLQPRGIGGGGAMSGLSISPYAKLWFVGTDMGTLFRSTNEGQLWQPIRHDQIVFGHDLSLSSSVGFLSDGKTVFFANSGAQPKRSLDSGVNWHPISIPLRPNERIKYWSGNSDDQNLIFCSTNLGIFRSEDKGKTWTKIDSIDGESIGTFHMTGNISSFNKKQILHATSNGIFISFDKGKTFKIWFNPTLLKIRAFAGGINESNLTLSFIDNDGEHACSWANSAKDSTTEQKKQTVDDCGFVWIMNANLNQLDPKNFLPRFEKTNKEGGRHLKMAENDPNTLFLTGGNWVRQYGSKVWVSENAGKNWNLKLHLYNWDTHPYSPWPANKLEYSAVALDVGWHDNAYPSFVVNQRNSSQAGGTGYYFLHMTSDKGEHWKAPFTAFADAPPKTKGKKWRSTGLEVTSIHKLKFHPKAPQLAYAAAADVGGLISQDGGNTWRISKALYNTNYDYAFDLDDTNVAFTASSSLHDFPLGNRSYIEGIEGAVLKTTDQGKSWTRLTPATKEWNIPFLSVAFNSKKKIIYAGTRGQGVAFSNDLGKTWRFINSGLPEKIKIVPQIEVDPETSDVYCLVSGDAPTYTNQTLTGVYVLEISKATQSYSPVWKHLRGTVSKPKEVTALDYKPWWFPSAFAVDFSDPKRSTLWLTDIESQGSWLGSGIWKTQNRGETWTRVQQFTHPTAIAIDPDNPSAVFASGLYTIDGSWGQGGALYTLNGGKTWKKNSQIPLMSNLDGIAFDPNQKSQLFYLFFGGGMLYGPKPK